MSRFIYGRTTHCCVGNCSNIATNWNGWLIKSRDGIVAGFCEQHKPEKPNVRHTYGQHNCRGIYNKNMGEDTRKHKPNSGDIKSKFGLDKNIIEQ